MVDRTACGSEFIEQDLDQGGLPATIGTKDANPVTTQDFTGERFENEMSVDFRGNVLSGDDLVSGDLLAGGDVKCNTAGPGAPLTVFLAHPEQVPYAPLIAGATGLDSLPDPCFLLGQFLVKDRVLFAFRFQGLLLSDQVGVIITVPPGQPATVKIQDRRGQHANK